MPERTPSGGSYRHPDPGRVADLIAAAAAEEAVPRFRSLAAHEVRDKGAGELVTVADVAVERRLAAAFRDLVPGSEVVGEEAFEADPTLMGHLDGDRPVWVIDPIDGTGNFARGEPNFAVMVAYVVYGEVHLAWIHDPIGGAMVFAERGGGAFEDGRRLAVAAPVDLPRMRGTLHAGTYGDPSLKPRVQAAAMRLDTVRSLRCAGHEYLRLARGLHHFSLFTRLMPWDHAPGNLIHAEAGGTSRYLDGAPYRPAEIDRPPILMAPDPESWTALRDLILNP